MQRQMSNDMSRDISRGSRTVVSKVTVLCLIDLSTILTFLLCTLQPLFRASNNDKIQCIL